MQDQIVVQQILAIQNGVYINLFDGEDVLLGENSRTYDLQSSVLHTGGVIRIVGVDNNNQTYRVEIPL